jgi:hypothetical protein
MYKAIFELSPTRMDFVSRLFSIQAMTDTDFEKKQWSFLATEENYQFVRDMHLRNTFIPIVGDFAGPKAIRSVASYLRKHNAIVSAFYTSNVEAYLTGTSGPVGRAMGGPEKLQEARKALIGSGGTE